MTKRTGLRLLAYARVSDVRGREGPGFISEKDQFARCTAYAEAYGHIIVEQGSDLDVSGAVMTRPTFDRFLERVRDGHADGIIVAKLDRFARTNVGALSAIETIEEAGGTLISVSEQIDSSTPAGRFLRTILFAAAQWERERIGEQWFASRSSAVERGIHVSRHVPPGYVRTKRSKDPATDRRLVPDPKHADTVREAFRMAAQGESNTEIAGYLTRQKLSGSYWQSFRVPRLLANRVYLGEARSGSGVVNAGAHEPLIDEETFLLAQRERRDGLSRPPRTSRAAVSILAGIVRCAGCGFAMKPQGRGKNSAAVYRCTKFSTHGVCPEPSTVTKTRLEEYVTGQFLGEFPSMALARSADDDESGDLVAQSVAAEQAYRAQLDNMELRATIGDDDHDRLIASLHRAWQAALEAAATQSPPERSVLPEGISLEDLVTDLRGSDRNEELRELLGSGIEAVFVRPAASRSHDLPVADRVKILWHGDESIALPRRGKRFEPRPFRW